MPYFSFSEVGFISAEEGFSGPRSASQEHWLAASASGLFQTRARFQGDSRSTPGSGISGPTPCDLDVQTGRTLGTVKSFPIRPHLPNQDLHDRFQILVDFLSPAPTNSGDYRYKYSS